MEFRKGMGALSERTASAGSIVLYAVGDIASSRSGEPTGLEEVAALLHDGDVVFFNCETPYAESGAPSGVVHGSMAHDPRALPGIAAAGFNVATLANNHVMDWGTEAVVECRDRLEKLGIAVCGAGRNLSEAHLPAILERNGLKIGFLGYSCTGPEITRAEDEKPGCAMVRAHTAYEPVDYYPGSPRIKIVTWPYADDLERMRQDIRRLRDVADVVIVTFHWGTIYVPAVIPDYETLIGHVAVDCGADLILGHSPHILKGIEIYKGRVIVHSLNHLLMEGASGAKSEFTADRAGVKSDPDTRKSLILRCEVSADGVGEVGFFPVLVDEEWSDPVVLAPESAEAAAVFDYMVEISRAAGFDTEFSRVGGKVRISARL
jgi:Bacterial capsule synthesis protein PGA_cap